MPAQRMAMRDLRPEQKRIVRVALEPWSRRLGVADGSGGFNADLWQGADAATFIQRHDKLRDDLAAMSRRGEEQDMRNVLMGRHNHNLEDANDQIRRMRNSRNPERMDLQKLNVSVPQAEADEQVSRAALELSGYQNVDSLKGTTTKATDIYAEHPKDGYELLIDAQVRGNPNGRLNISMLKGLDLSAEALQRDFRQLPDSALLMDYIRKIRDESRSKDRGRGLQSAREGKLMQTDNGFNDSPTKYFVDNAENLRKDGIITSLRPLARDIEGRLLPHKDHARLKNNSPAYNPELPVRWDLMDLDEARSVLSGLKVGDLRNRRSGLQVFFNPDFYNPQVTDSINIGINQRRLQELTGNLPPLASVVNEALVMPQ